MFRFGATGQIALNLHRMQILPGQEPELARMVQHAHMYYPNRKRAISMFGMAKLTLLTIQLVHKWVRTQHLSGWLG